jgi:DMSO reductase family type II enzyme heme b subunit
LPTSQLVHAVGEWRDGRWVIVMQRPLAVPSESDGITLAPSDRASVAFAIWDGAADDRDGKKSITIWQDLILEQ